MLNKIIRDFIKKGYFDTLSHISTDNSEGNQPISFFQSHKKFFMMKSLQLIKKPI